MKRAQTLQMLFALPGFRAKQRLRGLFGDPLVRIVELERRKKLRCAPAAGLAMALSTTSSHDRRATCRCWVGAFCSGSRDGV
jgi:hypothetical protein